MPPVLVDRDEPDLAVRDVVLVLRLAVVCRCGVWFDGLNDLVLRDDALFAEGSFAQGFAAASSSFARNWRCSQRFRS